MSGRWLVPLDADAGAAVDLVCLPWAGGGAVGYRDLRAHRPPALSLWAVAPPGREQRLMDPPEARFDAWIEAIGQEVLRLDRAPVLLGHSFGAILAYELAAWLRARGRPARLVCVSSRRSPDRPSKVAPLAAVDDAALVAWMRRLGGVHADILASAEMLELILPPLREDIRLDADYAPRGGPLDDPLLVFAGRDDPLVTPDEVAEWRAWTTADRGLHVVPGGHFHLLEHADLIFKEIERALGDGTARAQRAAP